MIVNGYAILQAVAWTIVLVVVGRAGASTLHARRMLRRERLAQARKTAADQRVDAAFLASHPKYQSPLHRGLRPGYTRDHAATVTRRLS